MSAPMCPDCGADLRSFETHAPYCRTRTPVTAPPDNAGRVAWLEHAYDERCRELTALRELHESVVGTAHQLRDERVAALRTLREALARLPTINVTFGNGTNAPQFAPPGLVREKVLAVVDSFIREAETR